MEKRGSPGIYLKNRVFLSWNYRLIVVPRKFDLLKTNICPRSKPSRANILALRTSNFQWETIRPIVPTQKHSIDLNCLYSSPIFLSARAISKRTSWIIVKLFWMTELKSEMHKWNVTSKKKKKQTKKFTKNPAYLANISRRGTINRVFSRMGTTGW